MVMSPVVVLICSSMKLLFFESRADAASLPLDTIKFPRTCHWLSGNGMLRTEHLRVSLGIPDQKSAVKFRKVDTAGSK